MWTSRATATVLAEVGPELERTSGVDLRVVAPGVELAGPLPPEVRSRVTFTAGVRSCDAAPRVAGRSIALLRGPAAARVILARGMERPPF